MESFWICSRHFDRSEKSPESITTSKSRFLTSVEMTRTDLSQVVEMTELSTINLFKDNKYTLTSRTDPHFNSHQRI
jgi:hypothetical protein